MWRPEDQVFKTRFGYRTSSRPTKATGQSQNETTMGLMAPVYWGFGIGDQVGTK